MDVATKWNLFETNPHMALDVAVEIMSVRIAKAVNKWYDADKGGDTENAKRLHDEVLRLMGIRDELYRGNEDVLRKVLDEAIANADGKDSEADSTGTGAPEGTGEPNGQ